jgi:copper/silver efflux system protein
VVREQVALPPGYSLSWSGQYEYMARAQERLNQVVPLTLAVIFLLLYMTFRSGTEALLVMLSLPFALVGGFWLIYLLGYNLSVAVAVGFIALAGVATEFGVVMLVYLDNALKQWQAEGRLNSRDDVKAAIEEGAVLRIRPKAMTVATIFAGLLPIMLLGGVGSEVMRPIAAPMIGGMITAPLLSLFVIPAIYVLWRGAGVERAPAAEDAAAPMDGEPGLSG